MNTKYHSQNIKKLQMLIELIVAIFNMNIRKAISYAMKTAVFGI